ncbi:MAG: hypothetical protein JKY04_09480 [Sneathiella sp.]|nr:hypothetical protein [Sneathiella sp.]
MIQAELHSLVSDFKSDFSKSPKMSRKTVADRANMANLAALDMLAETVSEKNTGTLQSKARSIGNLSRELGEITGIVGNLSKNS